MSKNHIVWSDMNLDLDDWRDDLIEQYPDASEDTLVSKMYEINNDYLDDTRANLDIQLSQSIIAVFNGQKSGTKNTIDYAKKKNVQVVNVI